MCFVYYYIFDSHSCDNIGQASENGSSVLIKFLTIEHVLNFITTTYFVNSELQHVYENQFAFFFVRNTNINEKENFKEIQTGIQKYFSL